MGIEKINLESFKGITFPLLVGFIIVFFTSMIIEVLKFRKEGIIIRITTNTVGAIFLSILLNALESTFDFHLFVYILIGIIFGIFDSFLINKIVDLSTDGNTLWKYFIKGLKKSGNNVAAGIGETLDGYEDEKSGKSKDVKDETTEQAKPENVPEDTTIEIIDNKSGDHQVTNREIADYLAIMMNVKNYKKVIKDKEIEKIIENMIHIDDKNEEEN